MHLAQFGRSLAVLSVFLVCGTAANADLITTNMNTSTPIFTFNIPSKGVNGESGYVGPNSITFDGSGPVPAYCTDLFKDIGIQDSYQASLEPLSNLANGSMVAKLFTVDASLHDTSWLEKAAMQLAIWNVVETGRAGMGLFTDPLAVDPSKVSTAHTFLRCLHGQLQNDIALWSEQQRSRGLRCERVGRAQSNG